MLLLSYKYRQLLFQTKFWTLRPCVKLCNNEVHVKKNVLVLVHRGGTTH
jgi:hypothetical protein